MSDLLLVLLAGAAVLAGPAPRGLPPRAPSASRAQGPRVPRWPRRHGQRAAGSGPAADDVADGLALLALALRSGVGLLEALDEVARCARGAVKRDLAAVVAGLRWGLAADEAWAYAGAAWRPAALAWQVAERTGAAPAELVESAALRLRESLERDRERRVGRAGVLLVLPLGLGFLPAFACTAVVPVVIALATEVLRG